LNEDLFQFLFGDAPTEPQTVTELTAEIRNTLESGFRNVWVEGEVVGFVAAASGHWYFTLNDGTSRLKCVCYSRQNFRIRFKPKNGLTVRLRGSVSFYQPNGELQLVVESLEPFGEGALAAAYEQIRGKLEGEGLFAEELKRPIPFFPRRVAVVTSRKGAAYHDIHTVLTRRAKTVSILLVPALVQGEGAADSIRRAIEALNAYCEEADDCDRIDVVIVGRGGGSAEDLWAFNDEALARAIRASKVPVISAVGHEIDWTISDFVADLRAATPSAAAEMVAGREEDILATLESLDAHMLNEIEHRLSAAASDLDSFGHRLAAGLNDGLSSARERIAAATGRLSPAALQARVSMLASSVSLLRQRCESGVRQIQCDKGEKLAVETAKLDALSPLAVMTRGYSITRTEAGEIVRDAGQVRRGDKLKISLQRGKLVAEVLAAETE
jgi:exodeoxyribonuclease VII large subunit